MTRASRFEGTIGRTVADSQPWFDEPPHPGVDAPNVVVVLLDDTGFAQFGCYGSDIDTPHVDALAANGLQFTNFHVTPLCSPTRAALLTGRSQHAVGMRSVSNFRTGFPHQLGHIANDAATMAEVLREQGYATFCVGKWHLAPLEQCSAAGPFDQWPLARGFDRFYGFLEGETDQFHPQLVCDNHPIEPPARPEDGYHLSQDLVDQALKMVSDSRGVRPDRPFFLYLPFGATHAPHQAPEAYLAKYRGRYDEGWDLLRQRWFDRQLESDVVPAKTELAPRNPGVDAWADLGDDQRKLACRLQEAFAAFLDHTDDQIGRLVAGLRDLGQLDNTLLLVLADNGASQEGGPYGVLHEMKFFNGIFDTPETVMHRLDDIGGPHSHTNYPWGWAQCGNTPFKWYKQNTHEGGVHVPMIVHYPDRIAVDQRGTKRDQFVYVSDIAATVYDLLGVTPPHNYRGIEQLPVTGHSFAGLIDDPDAPAANTVQYFEMMGSRAIIAGDWKAVCKHTPGADFDTERWELYHLGTDWSECTDLAAEQPERLSELIRLWWAEAEKHGVLPLDDRTIELFGARFRPNSPHPVDQHYVYRPPMSPQPGQAAAAIGGRSFDLTARITRSQGQDGVLFATGTENSGIAVFVQNDKLVVDYNAFDDHSIVESAVDVPAGDSTLVVRLRRGAGRTGSITVQVNGHAAGSVELPLVMMMISSVGASIGYNHGSAVSGRYQAPFAFAGKLHELDIQLVDDQDLATTGAEAAAEMSRQ
ncbi:MAG: arylsulfatase [Actinomycetota bacterium]|uniref:Arylsulfatase n=1 Tax=Mycobacterium lentiflavum TaxID=141349 RepID=A0ABY3UNM2_MYCLN|nr:arylsulfatase [Mycobacterium lentiflavum]MEE3064975.1 arylsulfatase [Actinomycetota bacterium]ULP41200.1 arylsulfatase [Mycobacterium lentiflavum]